MPLNLRLSYRKLGRARFISHLDLMRVFQQAFYRAELPLRFTEGFNPHAYVSVALPLPVGMESDCERLDVGVTGAMNLRALPERLNAVLPEGLIVQDALMGGRPFAQLLRADYEILTDSRVAPEGVAERFQRETIVEKRSKKGRVPTDISSLIYGIHCERTAEGLRVSATLSAQNPGLNAEYLAEAWRLYLDPDAVFQFRRVGLRDGSGGAFDAMR